MNACSLISCTGAAVLVVTACASAPEPSREEWLAATDRSYQGVTAEQVLAAAEQVFRLADPNDVTFEYGSDLLVAQRDWWFYGVFSFAFVHEIWEVRAVDANGAVHATVRFTCDQQAFGTSGCGRGPGPHGPKVYEFLWARVDYLLGRREDWPKCESPWNGWGLCGPFIEDLPPDGRRG